jgi:hypothetical protein
VRTALTRLLLITTAALALTGCGSEDAPASDDNVVKITIDGDQITPNGDRVEVSLGEPVTFDITADRAGELHVHSTPEQELAFDEGETKVEATFDQPGVVEVEDHETDKVVVQLQVS